MALLDAQVWGQGFEAPTFCDEVQVMQQRLVADKHLKLRLKLPGGVARDAVGYRIDGKADKGSEGIKKLRCIFDGRSFTRIMAMTPDGE